MELSTDTCGKNCNNGVFTGVFSCWCVACEYAGWAANSQLRLHVTGEYNYQQASKSQNMLHTVQFTPSDSHLYSRSQKLEISSVKRVKCSVNRRQRLAIYTGVAGKNASVQQVKTPVKTPLICSPSLKVTREALIVQSW